MKRSDLPSFCAIALAALARQSLAVPPPSPAPPPPPAPSHYEPLEFLIGHCWKGTFPGSDRTDEHCFRWMYGGKFVRDEHVVRGGDGRTLQSGESIYLWDTASGQLEYLYVESSGGYSRGAVSPQKDALVFPPALYVDPQSGTARSIRSRWQRTADDVYEVSTEFEVRDGWVPGFKARMQRVKDASRRVLP